MSTGLCTRSRCCPCKSVGRPSCSVRMDCFSSRGGATGTARFTGHCLSPLMSASVSIERLPCRPPSSASLRSGCTSSAPRDGCPRAHWRGWHLRHRQLRAAKVRSTCPMYLEMGRRCRKMGRGCPNTCTTTNRWQLSSMFYRFTFYEATNMRTRKRPPAPEAVESSRHQHHTPRDAFSRFDSLNLAQTVVNLQHCVQICTLTRL